MAKIGCGCFLLVVALGCFGAFFDDAADIDTLVVGVVALICAFFAFILHSVDKDKARLLKLIIGQNLRSYEAMVQLMGSGNDGNVKLHLSELIAEGKLPGLYLDTHGNLTDADGLNNPPEPVPVAQPLSPPTNVRDTCTGCGAPNTRRATVCEYCDKPLC